MKLDFLSQTMERFQPVLRENKTMEETAEAIIPDSCPDVTEVLYTGGMAFLRGKEIGDGQINLSAGVSAMALAKPEGRRRPEVVEVYIPMSIKLEDERLKSGMQCMAEAKLRRLDGFLVNSRKVMVRAAVTVEISVYEQVREEQPVECGTDGVQVLKKTVPVCCLTAMGEKSYTVEDSLRLNLDQITNELAGVQVEILHTDMRLTGTRAILRGEARLKLLCCCGEDKLEVADVMLPMSQYIDLGACMEEDELELNSFLGGADVELSTDGGGVNVTLQVITVAKVWGRREIPYLADLYSLSGEAVSEMETRSYDTLLDRQLFEPSGRGSVEQGSQRLLFCQGIYGDGGYERDGERIRFTLPMAVQALMLDEEGAYCGGGTRINLEMTTRAAEGCRFEMIPGRINISGTSGTQTTDLRVTATVGINTCCGTTVEAVVGGELSEEEGGKRRRSGLVIRRPEEGETLWEIAKAYHTTPEIIAAANGMESDSLPKKMLLIPGCR